MLIIQIAFLEWTGHHRVSSISLKQMPNPIPYHMLQPQLTSGDQADSFTAMCGLSNDVLLLAYNAAGIVALSLSTRALRTPSCHISNRKVLAMEYNSNTKILFLVVNDTDNRVLELLAVNCYNYDFQAMASILLEPQPLFSPGWLVVCRYRVLLENTISVSIIVYELDNHVNIFRQVGIVNPPADFRDFACQNRDGKKYMIAITYNSFILLFQLVKKQHSNLIALEHVADTNISDSLKLLFKEKWLLVAGSPIEQNSHAIQSFLVTGTKFRKQKQLIGPNDQISVTQWTLAGDRLVIASPTNLYVFEFENDVEDNAKADSSKAKAPKRKQISWMIVKISWCLNQALII